MGNGTPVLRLLPFIAGMAQGLLGAVPPTAQAQDATSIPSVVIVGGNRDYPPYEFIDKSGQPAGYNVDLTRAIAEVMGMTVEIRLGEWSEMRKALRSGSVDVLQGISYSEERTSELDFAPPHAIVHQAIFARVSVSLRRG